MMSGRVLYADPLARIDRKAQEQITFVSKEAKKEHPVSLIELENICRNIVDYKCNELDFLSAQQELYDIGFSNEAMHFFGFPNLMEDLKNLVEDFCSYKNYTFYEGYSENGMNGKRCIGIKCTNPMKVLAELVLYVTSKVEKMTDEMYEVLSNPEHENWGNEQILYFPQILC